MASENETLKSPLYGEVGGRSKSRKNKGPKKPPQRGLGVEQLERMRAQEAFKKMAEASGVFHIDHHNQQQQQQQQVLLRYGALSSNVPFQFPQQQMMINENNNNSTNVGASAFGPYKNGFGVGTCSNVASGWFLPNNQHNNKAINHFGSGSSLLRNPLEPTKDLSSMQNLNSQCFDLCLKVFFTIFCVHSNEYFIY